MKKEFLIVDPVGLHARPATLIVNEISKFASEATIISGDKEANLKSIMGVMSLGIAKDTVCAIEITGTDEEAAMTAMTKIMVDSNIAEVK